MTGGPTVDAGVPRTGLAARECASFADADTDVLLDAHVPSWRFPVQGRDAVIELLRRWFPTPDRFTVREQWQTSDRDVLGQPEWHEDSPGGDITVRDMQLLRLDGGRIREQVVHCAVRRDEALVTAMRRQASLVRP